MPLLTEPVRSAPTASVTGASHVTTTRISLPTIPGKTVRVKALGHELTVGHPPPFAYVIYITLSSLTCSVTVFHRNLEEVMALNNFPRCPELVHLIMGVRA